MIFRSILSPQTEEAVKRETPEIPVFFVDLNLDQIVDGVTAGKQEYNLKPFFYTSLKNRDAIYYRQEVFRDLEDQNLFENIKSFAQKMRAMREHLAQADKLYYPYQKEAWFLDAVEIYCQAIHSLMYDLSLADLRSRGFRAFREYLTNYANSDPFRSLLAETRRALENLASVKYCLVLKDGTIKVRKYEGEMDSSAEVEKTFEKFKQGAVKDYRITFTNSPDMNHVEAKILDLVAQLYPDVFSYLDDYCLNNRNYLNETIGVFDREIQFYVAYLEFASLFKQAGYKFCYPQIADERKEIYDSEGYDLALAYKLIGGNSPVVTNDFYLRNRERIFVVSGPNQGGKTTFARTFGQLHYLASTGCPIPGREAQMFLFDRLFTHFEKEEKMNNLRGKLQDDLVRIHDILSQATSNSIVVLNEIFTSTTVQDALFLSQKVLEKITSLDLLCVWVTFIEELASFSEQTVSMVSTVAPENPTQRTYKIIRKPADGLSYAIAIAEKYRLTYHSLKERVPS